MVVRGFLASLATIALLAGCSDGDEVPSENETLEVPETLERDATVDAGSAETSAPERIARSEAMGPPEPPTSLPLTLLATMASPDPQQARATIRDEAKKVIATYRAGDAIRDDVRLVGVDRGFAIVEREGGERESLVMGDTTVELAADDVFYPDLVDELDLPNSMADAVQLTPGPGYVVKKPVFAWGTPRTVHLLREAMRLYTRAVRGSPAVHVGDISKREGGPFPPHLSHQSGRDIDIGYVLRGHQAEVTRFLPAVEGNLDRERTWALVEALLATEGVAYIFMDYDVQRTLYEHARAAGVDQARLDRIFQYPHGRYAWRGIIRHWRGHDDHFHVRMAR